MANWTAESSRTNTAGRRHDVHDRDGLAPTPVPPDRPGAAEIIIVDTSGSMASPHQDLVGGRGGRRSTPWSTTRGSRWSSATKRRAALPTTGGMVQASELTAAKHAKRSVT